MIDPIARSIVKNRKPIIISESSAVLTEADADKKYLDLNDEEEHDDSQAPIQGTPDEDNPKPSEDTKEDNEEEVHDFEVPKPHKSRGSSTPKSEPQDMEPDAGENKEDIPDEEENTEDTASPQYDNPLDNPYAVSFTLGDDISLVMTGLKTSTPKKGVIDGYDSEGFYRVKWSDESTTSGLTDTALESFIDKKSVKECICGCRKLVVENNKVVCDSCGRLVEGLDSLTLADKSRPKGKRLIRSECHPISTAAKPDIPLSESGEDLEDDTFASLSQLENQFWSRENEMIEDIEDLGYEVEESNSEYIVVSSPDDENVYKIPIVGTSRSMVLDLEHAKLI